MKNRYTFMVSIALALGTTSVFAAENTWGLKSRDFALAEREAADAYIALCEEMAGLDPSDAAALSELEKAKGRASADMAYCSRLQGRLSRGSSDERKVVRFSPASTPRTTPTVSRLGSAAGSCLDLTAEFSPRPASASSSSPAESFGGTNSPRKLVLSPGRASSHARAASTSLLPVLEGDDEQAEVRMFEIVKTERAQAPVESSVARFPLISDSRPRSAAAILEKLTGQQGKKSGFKRPGSTTPQTAQLPNIN